MKKTALLLFLLASTSCSFQKEDSKTSGVVQRDNLWPNPSAISVCWASSVGLSATALSEIKTQIRDLVTSQFSRTSRVRFIGWTDCSGTTNDVVRVSLRGDQPGGGRSMVGRTLDRVGLNLATDTGQACSDCTLYVGVQNRTMQAVIHEFGHAAGLLHEHERTDRSSVCRTYNETTPETGNTDYATPYDPNSVMHYCRSAQTLSDNDINALNSLYPVNFKALSTKNAVIALVSDHNQLCLDVENPDENADTPNGNRMQVYDCNTRPYRNNQMWELRPTSRNGYYQLVSTHSNRCLDVEAPNPAVDGRANGTRVQIYDCIANRSNQEWYFKRKAERVYELRSAMSGMCLDIPSAGPGDAMGNGTGVQMWNCNTRPYQKNQEWKANFVTFIGQGFSYFN